MDMFNQTLQGLTKETYKNAMIDFRGIGKPGTYNGDENKYQEWIAKLNAYVRAQSQEGMHMLEAFCKDRDAQGQMYDTTDEAIRIWANQFNANPEGMIDFSAKIYSILVTITEDDAFKIVNSVRAGDGIGAYRLLKKRYEPTTPGTTRSILKAIINNPQCKKVNEVESNLMNVEQLIKIYDNLTDTSEKLPGNLIVAVYIDLCPRDLREHLELQTCDLTSLGVRKEIVNYVERKRETINNQVKAMEVDNVEPDYDQDQQWPEWHGNEYDWNGYYHSEEINYMGKGKGKGKGN